jgi:hypothetical protein
LAFKFNFLDRPIVNEYAQMLRNMLTRLGGENKPNNKPFHFILTHDVDGLLMWHNWRHVIRTAGGDILKRNQPKIAMSRLKDYYAISRQKINDPFDTYDTLMDISEHLGLKSHFYFMSGGATEYDCRTPYDITGPNARGILKKIEDRGHLIGFHPSYDTYMNKTMWQEERQKLQDQCSQSIATGRQHYLRFQVPHTWQLWQDCGMKIDSTCGFADREGFRCGTGHTFPVFNILTRKKLQLKEQPLIFMDSRSFFCGGFEGEPFTHNMAAIIEGAKLFHTPITLLFHNNYKHEGFAPLYQDILKLAAPSSQEEPGILS